MISGSELKNLSTNNVENCFMAVELKNSDELTSFLKRVRVTLNKMWLQNRFFFYFSSRNYALTFSAYKCSGPCQNTCIGIDGDQVVTTTMSRVVFSVHLNNSKTTISWESWIIATFTPYVNIQVSYKTMSQMRPESSRLNVILT